MVIVDSQIELMEEVIAEDLEAMHELVMEDIVPILKYAKEQEKKMFDKAYKEVTELEEES